MTRVASLILVVAMCVTTHAGQETPSNAVLAEMGLSGLVILSDREASVIRGLGFEPGSHLAGFESYQQSKADFKETVAEFRERIKHHTFAGTAGFKKSQENFHRHVQRFHEAVKEFKHKIH
jgi:hypothetical protein